MVTSGGDLGGDASGDLGGDRGPIDIGRSLGLSASKPSFSAAIVRNDSECG